MSGRYVGTDYESACSSTPLSIAPCIILVCLSGVSAVLMDKQLENILNAKEPFLFAWLSVDSISGCIYSTVSTVFSALKDALDHEAHLQ